MRNRGIHKVFILIAYCIVVFFLSIIIISNIMNRGNNDLTVKLQEPTFPILSFTYKNMEVNMLSGYTDEMDVSVFHDNVTPMAGDRKLSYKLRTYGNEISKISYELRSVDGQRLVESSSAYNYVENQDEITGDIVFKDLILENTDYALCVIVTTGDGREIRYYTRVVEAPEYNTLDKLSFVYYFSEATFDKAAASNQITTYIESNESGDNTTLGHVDIHSSLDQITWGDLGVKRVNQPIATIQAMDNEIAIISLDYFVYTGGSKVKNYYDVRETFRIRQGSERIYLLNYERSMNQVFDVDSAVLKNNKISLGIVNPDINILENEDGSRFAFVNEGRLFSFNSEDNKLAYVFGFYDNVTDYRETADNNNIRICSIDESGNIYFIVYGYMCRGLHEGQMGCCVYYYDSIRNTVEERAFVKTNQPYELLSREVGRFAYVNSNEHCYINIEHNIYDINLSDDTYEIIATGLSEGELVVSDSGTMAAWIADGADSSTCLQWLDMVSGDIISVDALAGSYIRPVGFFDDNLIYGEAAKNDLFENLSGKMIFPMNSIYIIDRMKKELKHYSVPDTYVVETEYASSMVTLKRIKKSADGYVDTTDDQLLGNQNAVELKNNIETVAIEIYEKVTEITVRKEFDNKKTQILTPRQVMFEGDRTITIEKPSDSYVYYVYAMGQLFDIYDNPADAVNAAYINGGIVYDYNGREIYRKTSRIPKNQIMAITGNSAGEDASPRELRAVCIDTILEYEGITANTYAQAEQGAEAILSEKLEGAIVLNLCGCPLDAMLSYVEKDIPVLVLQNDGSAVLVIGYNELNTVVMYPDTGLVTKVGMNDSISWFEENGNRFITYIKPVD